MLSNKSSINELPCDEPSADELGHLALASLPIITQDTIKRCGRVILVANNPSIDTQTLDDLWQPNDVIILFNHFIHAPYFVTHPVAKSLPKLVFFRQIGDSQLHFGLPPRHNNLPFIEQMVKQSDVGFLFSNVLYSFPTLADDPSPDDDPIDATVQLTLNDDLTARLQSTQYAKAISEAHPVVADYPIFKHIHSSAPTSGFFIYRLTLAIQNHLRKRHNHEIEIILIGFNHDKKTDHFWHGHNWAFEREEMQNLPDSVTVIKQY